MSATTNVDGVASKKESKEVTMRFMAIKRGFPLLVAAFLALALAACSSSSGVKSERDDALDRVAELEDMLATAEMKRDAANGEVTRLTGELGTATGEVTRLTGELGTATGEVTRLTGELATANGEVSRLTGELGTANGEVSRLMGELQTAMNTIGDPGDAPDENGSLHAQLNAANARIAELEAGTAPDQLDPIKTAAGQAVSDANDAYMAASTAAGEADAKAENRATVQTGKANSVYDAMMAGIAANAAMTAAADAQTAATAAMAAGNVSDATAEKAKADMARDAAMEAQTAAEGHRDDAVADAAAELKIVDTVKSVGDTTIDATAGSNVVTVGEGDDEQTTHTGQIKSMTPMTTGAGVTLGVTAVQDDPTTDDVNEAIKHVQQVEDRTFGIGKVVDSADDAARLMIITQYAGKSNVYVYNLGTDTEAGTKAGYISIDDTGTTDVTEENNVRLKSEGTFYAAGTAGGGEGALAAADEVAAATKAVEVFSYIDIEAADAKKYVVLTTESTTSGTTTYTYTNVDVEVTVPANGGDSEAFDMKVQAALPEATDYDHIHFGVWVGLKGAAKSGAQNLADLGIGFVQNYSNSGTTGADMPNNGTGNYSGNWAAAVQAEDEDGNGAINLRSGAASVIANFGKGTIEATLTDLATLEGDISVNTFSGTKASEISDTHGLDADADFDGSFKGGFYGPKAVEAGGVFEFASEDNEGGAFRGAFGGQRTD